MSAANFLARHDVSRETLDRLSRYEALLRKWNPAINLVAKSTMEHVWDRHFLDSAQIFDIADPEATTWADLGTGGGFPGIVVAILAAGAHRPLQVTLVESDQRKAAFLSAAVRELKISATVLAQRIEAIPPLGVDVVTARALAPLSVLVEYAALHLAPEGQALFPKGANHATELSQALEKWNFSYETINSVTEGGAAIYCIKGISRA